MTAFALTAVCLCASCSTSSITRNFACSDEILGEWEIPAAWMERELTRTEARVEVLTANLSKESMEARWETLLGQWQPGDEFWLYRRVDEDSLHALGVLRGVVLIRSCEQLGFVTTRIATEDPR